MIYLPQMTNSQTLVISEDLNWGYLISEFVSKSDFSKATAESYRRRLRAFEYWLSANKVQVPTPQDIISYKKYLETKLNSPLSISNYLTSCRQLFIWLESELIFPNVAKKLKNPQKPRGFRKDALDVEQVKKLLQIDRGTLIGKRNFALINLMIRTSKRCIEIARADIGDIQKREGRYILWVRGKGRVDKDSFVVLTPNTLAPIEDYLFHRNDSSPDSPLFASLSTNCTNQRLSTRSIRRIIKNRMKEIHLTSNKYSAHGLRHTSITLALLAGAPLQEVKEMATHENINTTLIYAQNIKKLEGIAENAIEQLLLNED